ncbi:hypothetical protein [Mycobacterium sp.]|uniref:hypothetical protein n=1 Tax=Mycobacterium sp. TaxID=1785 RepID=UPI003D0DDACF
MKLIDNALLAAHIGLLADAIGVGARLGVTESALLRALPHGRRIRGQGHRGGPTHRY